MPVNIKAKVVLSKRLQFAATIGAQTVLNELTKAMTAAVLETETRIKEYITEIGLLQDGRLRNSIHGEVRSVSIRQAVGEVATSNVKYARIQEYGGTITPKNGQALAIPFNRDSARIEAMGSLRNVAGLYVIQRNGYALLVSSKDTHIGWTLVKSVHIREKRYMRTGLDRAMPKVKEFFRTAATRAMRLVFGKEGAE